MAVNGPSSNNDSASILAGDVTKSPHKILMLIGLFHPFIGGAERECQNLSKKFIALHHSVTVLTAFQEGLPSFEMVDGIPVHRKIRGWHFFELTYMLSVFMLLWRYRKNFNHIICFGLYLYTAPAVLFALCAGKKVSFRLECSGVFGDFQRIAKLQCEKFILRCARWAHTIIAISTDIEQELLSHGFAQKKIIRIPNSVDTRRFSVCVKPEPSGLPLITFIGRLDRQKGIDILLEALRLLMDKAVPFKACLVGDGPNRQELFEQAERLSLSGVVTFAGMQQDTVPYYRQADILVMPSRQEGLPLVLLEGMAGGLGIVAASVGGIPEVLSPAGSMQTACAGYTVCAHGLMVAPENAAALAAALQRLMEDAGLLRQIGSAARKHIEELYSLDIVAERYLRLMRMR